jgi:hypothetical protein
MPGSGRHDSDVGFSVFVSSGMGIDSVSLFGDGWSSGSRMTCAFCMPRLLFSWRKSRMRVIGARIGTHRPYRAGRASIGAGSGREEIGGGEEDDEQGRKRE